MKLVIKNNQEILEDVRFLEWFYKAAKIAGVLKNQWESFEILGFCDKNAAEAILSPYSNKMIIRFADTMLGEMRLSMKKEHNPNLSNPTCKRFV